jgi:hypothetical protein
MTQQTKPDARQLNAISWSDLHKPQQINWKDEAIECALFTVFIVCLVAFWLVLPAWLEG